MFNQLRYHASRIGYLINQSGSSSIDFLCGGGLVVHGLVYVGWTSACSGRTVDCRYSFILDQFMPLDGLVGPLGALTASRE